MALNRPKPLPLLPILTDPIPCWACQGLRTPGWACIACHGTGEELTTGLNPDQVRARLTISSAPKPVRGVYWPLVLGTSPALLSLLATVYFVAVAKGWL